MKNTKDLRDLTPKELETELLSLRGEQFKLRMKKANGLLDKTHFINGIRKAIARVKTIMAEKAE